MPLHTRILVGVLLGALAGALAHAVAPGHPLVDGLVRYGTRPAGQVFLRLLFMMVLPLVFSSLILGIAELGDLRRLGRIGARTLAATIGVSTVAVLIGVFLVNLVRPGEGLSDEARAALLVGAAERATTITSAPPPRSGPELLVRIVPDNLAAAMANGDMLAVMFAAVVVGVALASADALTRDRLLGPLQAIHDLSMTIIGWVLQLAPFGVAALLFSLTAELGGEVLTQLAWFVGVVLLGLGLHLVVVYSVAVSWFGGMSPLRFFGGIREALLTAFSTASSAATLPTSLRVADELGLPRHVSRFVLTVGATANQNGTALFEGVTVLFLAQFYGVELTVAQQLAVCAVCVLGGVGTAGVPAGSLPVVVMILGMVGVPAEGIGLVIGVDRFLDMCRTTLNVAGDLAITVVVARGAEAEALAPVALPP